jgi:hypothetical protein
MVVVAGIYLSFYIKVGVRVSTFLPTLDYTKIPSDSEPTPQPWLHHGKLYLIIYIETPIN